MLIQKVSEQGSVVNDPEPIHLSERIRFLREKVLNTKPSICTERARFYTEAYSEHEDQPVIIRRAFALEKTLQNMTIFIERDELIAGNQSSQHRAAPVFPEYAVDWLPKEMNDLDKRPGDAFFITEEHKRELVEIASWWKGKVLYDKGRALMSQELRDLQDAAIIKATGNLTSGDAHIAVDFHKILKIGLNGYLAEINSFHTEIDRSGQDGIRKDHFYTALIMSIKAFSIFILRYSHLAASLATKEENPERKKELLIISRNCELIAGEPPQNFYQALQLVYFVQLVLQIESNGHSVSLGRFDQYLFPFYLNDLNNGSIDDNEVLELLENTWIKLVAHSVLSRWPAIPKCHNRRTKTRRIRCCK
jgi:pyruvate-formate lyase